MTCIECNGSGYRRLCNYDAVSNKCKQTLGKTSFKCVGTGYGGTNQKCIKINEAPGNGKYSNIQECQQHCGENGYVKNISSPSYKCKVKYGSVGVNTDCDKVCRHIDGSTKDIDNPSYECTVKYGSFGFKTNCNKMCSDTRSSINLNVKRGNPIPSVVVGIY